MESVADQIQVFGVPQADKNAKLTPLLWSLTRQHREHCSEYRRLLDSLGSPTDGQLVDLPWLPVRLFKQRLLASIPEEQYFRVLTSSGTTGQQVSRIVLDTAAARAQTKYLSLTMQEVLGTKRLPMLIIDSRSVFAGPTISARGAGVLGMMNFGHHHAFALDENLKLDQSAVRNFLESYGSEPFLVFGFTFLVWEFLAESAIIHGIDVSNAILVHSGGWKKLIDRAVPAQEFRRRLSEATGLERIFNFYGMVEQIGTVFLESEAGDGSLTAPAFADVIIRDPLTMEPVADGETGLIQLVSLLPTSYPGHSILTEDLGVIVGTDDTPRLGRRIRVLGRLPRAEARGCSDTFTSGAT
jgi:hypothetical protein